MEWAEGGGGEGGETAQGKGEQKCDDHWRDTRVLESVFSFFKVSAIIAYLYAKGSGSVERD